LDEQAAGSGEPRSAGYPPNVAQAHCLGTIHYPGRATPGRLVYIKAGVPHGAPWDVRNYADAHAGFPTDPTLGQFFDTERLEAYRALGEYIAEMALRDCWVEFATWKAGRSAPAGLDRHVS
jgi:hypothetical protein